MANKVRKMTNLLARSLIAVQKVRYPKSKRNSHLSEITIDNSAPKAQTNRIGR